MKIELTYDPVKPETTVCIDGQITDKTDIYGFLYPVRNCLLQTWLRPTGSWNGLAWQLRELSRGDDIELTFCGRPEDYADVQIALKDMPELDLSFRQRDPLSSYTQLFDQLDDQITAIFDESKKDSDKKTIHDLFPETVNAVQAVQTAQRSAWLHTICSEKDFYLADQAAYSCCVVREEYLDSYEKLERLNSLTRSMRRSQDMICCCIDDMEKRSDFAHYAQQFDNLEMRFDTAEQCIPALERKYGVPYNIRCQYLKYQRILEILEQCYAKREQIAARKKELSKMKKPNAPEIRELDRSKNMLLWYAGKEPYLIKLAELLENRNSLFWKGKE